MMVPVPAVVLADAGAAAPSIRPKIMRARTPITFTVPL
jgi:hypothetical protein